MPEKIAVDFVKEKDGWKIWHIVVSTDLVSEAGEDYSEQEVYHNYETNPVDVEFGTPTIAKLIHNTDFNWWDNYPPMPDTPIFTDARMRQGNGQISGQEIRTAPGHIFLAA